MQQLTLTWLNHSPPITLVLQPHQPTKTPGRLRIGRDPQACDLILPSVTADDCLVSRLHAEIYFEPESHHFYLRNFKGGKPLLTIEGSLVQSEPVPLLKTSLLQLAHHRFQISIKAEAEAKTEAEAEAKLKVAPVKPLLCPHCATGYTYAESAQINGRCRKDGFLLYGHSVCISFDR